MCSQVLASAPHQVAEYRSGKTKLMGFFIKQVLDATKGSADPVVTQQVLKDLLTS